MYSMYVVAYIAYMDFFQVIRRFYESDGDYSVLLYYRLGFCT